MVLRSSPAGFGHDAIHRAQKGMKRVFMNVARREVFYREILDGLRRRGKTVVVITHDDRYFDCADRIVKLDVGRVVTPVDAREN